MERVSSLEENMDVLRDEMSVLKHVRDDVVRRGDKKMDRWLQIVDAQAREVDKLRKELNEARKGGSSKYKLEVHKRVITILEAVDGLKKTGNRNVLEHRIGAASILQGNVQHNGVGRSSETVERFIRQMEREKPLRFSSNEIKFFTSNFSIHLGRGGYGDVFKGQFPNGVQIAVKVLKEKGSDVMKKQFMAEMGTMGRTYHRNLVRLYGFCFEDNMKALIYEFMEKGSLDKILYDNHLKLEWNKLYDIATETAKGLSYLHENCHKRIIHCDIKAGNVLIDSNLCPKVADFGLAKLYNWDSSHVTLTHFRGTPGYAAPEVGMPLPITYKCDVYSFGMLLFEILGRKRNTNKYMGKQQEWFPAQVWKRYEMGKSEEIIMECGIEMKDRGKAKTLLVVALWCAQYVPHNRPSMSTVVKILEGEIQLVNPPNPFLRVAASTATSMVTAEIPECVSSLVSAEVDITRKKNHIRSKIPISFSRVSSEDPSVSTKWQVELESPLPKPTVPMKKKIEETKVVMPEEKNVEVITVDLMVYMHCKACSQDLGKWLRKMKGVQTATTDLERSQVTVKGIVDPQQLVDYIYKKTNKRAVILKSVAQKVDGPKATAEAKVKPENKTNKRGIIGKTELQKVEEAKAVARSKKQEKFVAETVAEKKPIKRALPVIDESEREDTKEIVHTEVEKKRNYDPRLKTNATKRREERKGSDVIRVSTQPPSQTGSKWHRPVRGGLSQGGVTESETGYPIFILFYFLLFLFYFLLHFNYI